MIRHIDFSEINSVEGLLLLRVACAIVADDGDSRAVLFECLKQGGLILKIELKRGQVLFEGPDFCDTCWAVNMAKGSCRVNPGKKPAVVEFKEELKPTNRIELLFDDDDDDGGWNGGQI